MREVLFRGKLKKDNGHLKKGDWVQGHYVVLQDGKKQMPYIYGFGEIIPETLGEFTGLTDKNGKKIFEGDILDVVTNHHYTGLSHERLGIFEVVFYKTCFMKRSPKKIGAFHFISTDEHKVIGNIHDNKELLEVENNG